jgi:hypothetical protein
MEWRLRLHRFWRVGLCSSSILDSRLRQIRWRGNESGRLRHHITGGIPLVWGIQAANRRKDARRPIVTADVSARQGRLRDKPSRAWLRNSIRLVKIGQQAKSGSRGSSPRRSLPWMARSALAWAHDRTFVGLVRTVCRDAELRGHNGLAFHVKSFLERQPHRIRLGRQVSCSRRNDVSIRSRFSWLAHRYRLASV